MTDSHKPKRTYNSKRRQVQAQQTRRQIADAARRLFIQYGYAGATVEAIAEEAGVAVKTVYAVFGNKRKILVQLLDTAVGGDDASIPILERPGPQATFQQRDQREQLRMIAQGITAIMERAAPVLEIMRVAAKIEPDIAELHQQILKERWQNLEVTMQHVATNGAWREGITTARAADTLWALTSAEVFLLLTMDRGWSKEQYIEWLEDSLIHMLLP